MEKSNKEKQQIQTEKKRVHDIIKYDVNRKYFGDWSPAGLNATYNSPTPVSFYIGILSVDKICNALWKEMSCNPERFGTVSPFKFNGQNSIDFFISQDIDIYDNNYEILTILQSYLSRFWNLALQYDKEFMITNRFKSTHIIISTKMQPGAKPIPSATYRMLGYLRDSIHKIATQNLTDFEKAPYRDQIVDIIKSRYPQYFNTAKPMDADEELEKYLSDRKYLMDAIWNKNFEIMDTQKRIDTLNEFENPGDTSNDVALLKTQNSDLKTMENALQAITHQINRLMQNREH